MTIGISPWTAAASNTFADDDLSAIYTKQCGKFKFTAHLINDSLWILATWPKGGKLAFRTAYSPEGEVTIKKQHETANGISFSLNSVIGEFDVDIAFPESEHDILRYTTSLKPQTDLLIPFWPRDIIIPGNDGKLENTAGNIRTSQVGTRSGLIYFHITRPKAGSVMYFQNITALNDYFKQTETSGAELVRGEWPELGLALPPATKKPLAAGKKIVISDAFVSFSREVPADEAAMVRQYLDMLANLYLQLPLPQTKYNDWPIITENGLKDGNIEVTNTCLKEGKIKKAIGKAVVKDKKTNAKLSVTFFWPFSGKYWIIALAPDYSYAVVGHPNRDYLWILSRKPVMDEQTYRMLLVQVAEKGFDIRKLVKTNQSCNN